MSSASEVMERLKHEDRVYLTHINTPKEVVIAGDKQGCLRVIKNLNCDYFRAPASDAIHCEPMRSEYDEFVKSLTLPVQNQAQINFYSAADYERTTLDSQVIGHKIAKALCQQIDFPRLVNRVYEDGTRIFIELGPGGSCSRGISETLKQKEHLTMFINSRGVDDHTGIVRVLAKLLSHQVPMDISPLYSQLTENFTIKKSLVKTIILGGCRLSSTILTEENRKSFANQSLPVLAQNISQHKLLSNPQRSEVKEVASLVIQSNQEKSGVVSAEICSDMHSLHYQKLSKNTSLATQTHATFLQVRREALRQMSEMIQLQIAVSQQMLDHKPTKFVFDEVDLLEFAAGKISRVFGKEYENIDSYSRRVRLPMPPYLFISRVTKFEAKRGHFEPCSIETEYDIPQNAWYASGGQIPGAVAAESCQGNMLLISYLGIDFENKGERVYRALDGTSTYVGEIPKVGETLRCSVKINSFARGGDILLYFFTCEYFVGDRMFLKVSSGAGFFSDADLKKGQGVTFTKQEKEERSKIQKRHFSPLLLCQKTAFDDDDLLHLSAGNIADCFGPNYDQKGKNPSLLLPSQAIRMIDRVVSVDLKGGIWGLGLVVAEKTLDPKQWYFNCHFKDELCLPGTIINEGCTQLLLFYMLYLGLQTCTTDASFQPIPHLTLSARGRGQITPVSAVLTYRLEVTEIGLEPKPFVKGDAAVIFNGKTISLVKNLGIQLSEKNL